MTIRILLVDDRYLIQEGVKAILKDEADLEIIGTAKNGLEAISWAEKFKPDIVLLDIEMPQMNGIVATKHILRVSPATKIIMLSSHDKPEYITQALAAGASSYLLKETFIEDLKQAIYSLSRGYSYIEAKLLNRVLARTKANNIVNAQKKAIYLRKQGKNICVPKTSPANQSATVSPVSVPNKSDGGISKASLAPIFELSHSDEIETIDKLTASLNGGGTVSKSKNRSSKYSWQKLIWLLLAIASAILSILIF